MPNTDDNKIKIVSLTTVDNPYDYFTHFDEWYGYEVLTGSRALTALGKFAFTSPSLSYAENAKEMERAVDEIIKYDYGKEFKKIEKYEDRVV